MNNAPRADALKDFRNFVFFLWRELRLPPPTDVQYDIAQFLQHGPKRRMVKAFRGVGKSWLTAALVLYRLYHNPNERVMVVSAAKDRADAFSTFLKRLINDVEWLNHLKPDPSRGQRDSVVAFDVGPSDPHQAPSVRSVGITGMMTGGRATILVADDVETPKNSMTQLMRDRLAELVKEFDAIITPDAEIIYLGTPQCEDSLYNLLPQRGYVTRTWPARKPNPSWMEQYGVTLTPFMQNLLKGLPDEVASTDPARFSAEDLTERELSYGRTGFALQFQLDTRLRDKDAYPLKLGDLITMGVGSMAPLKVVWGGSQDQIAEDIPSVGLRGDRWRRPAFVTHDHASFTGSVMFIDPSGRGVDETSYAVVKVSNGLLYLVASGGFRDGYSDAVLEALVNVAKRHEVNKILVEPNFGDGMFLKLLTPWVKQIHPCSLEEAPRAVVQKEKRIIDTLEPVLNQHRLIVCESVVKEDFKEEDLHRQLFYQLSRITSDRGSLRHDDRLDALAGAVAYFTRHMAASVSEAETARRDALMKKYIRKHLQNQIDPKNRKPKHSRNRIEMVV